MTTDSSKSSIIVPSSYRRSVGFFLGLAVAVALLVMALEYNSAPADYDIDLSLLEHLDKDEEMIPVMEHQDLRPTVVEKEPESEPSVSEKRRCPKPCRKTLPRCRQWCSTSTATPQICA